MNDAVRRYVPTCAKVVSPAVWVRARVDRSAVAGNPTVYDQSLHGTVEKVLLNR